MNAVHRLVTRILEYDRMRPLIIAHRGAPGYLPEHTESSYRLAIRQGADFVEPDVVPSRDGVLIIRHERRLDDTTDIASQPEFADRRRDFDELHGEAGWFAEDFDWAELQQLHGVERVPEIRPASAAHSGEERILRLRELIEIVESEAQARGRHCGLVIELKHDAHCLAKGFDFVELLARELDGLWDLDPLSDLRIESFEAPVLDRLRDAGSAAKLIVLVGAAGETLPTEEDPRRLTPAGLEDAAARFDGISVRTSLLGQDDPLDAEACARGRELVAAAHDHGLEVLTYTLRAEDVFLPAAYAGRPVAYWQALIDTGIDGAFADAPDQVATLRAHDGAPIPE
ncbi:glycerophosphodiester phosphodiesterase family protein [Gulosibacter molinativorax]|uniref:glycerophosphodiester phosphodiesterase n=1 Tax=Gulosibacter molinativorax TaxID=256821 RepID=A0ABT7C5Q4_9MICO|nr:glycerophosphodiester phosphodiesterase family protein [Gulosibacter molinativorax]MDJ1370006.1 glycerophosphodiester phosphodiesterase [Gulosibacter molinativorax]QUY63804.1 Glycerophosphoryl diester phosphodiesterase [Gulosibacter molinativorax]